MLALEERHLSTSLYAAAEWESAISEDNKLVGLRGGLQTISDKIEVNSAMGFH